MHTCYFWYTTTFLGLEKDCQKERKSATNISSNIGNVLVGIFGVLDGIFGVLDGGAKVKILGAGQNSA